ATIIPHALNGRLGKYLTESRKVQGYYVYDWICKTTIVRIPTRGKTRVWAFPGVVDGRLR
ncbi:hypothetical protein BaRGS_00001432, partial [Batillaria attramentaria]